MRAFLTAVMAMALLTGSASMAKADYFVWEDTKTGLTLSYPDTWQVENGQDHDDLVTLAAPSGRAHAFCRIRSHEDKRYAIFPPRFNPSVQKIEYSLNFWDQYLREYKHPELYNLQDGTGLGRGWASFAEGGYVGSVPYPEMERRAVLFASLYNNRVYVLDCSAHKDAYDQWKEQFLSIAKSIDFKKANHELMTGNYRNFMNDGRMLLPDEGINYVTSY
ncbi:MAG: hypothetical protein NDJ24_08600 [Alphaproteobacteria bacterium]|nr:hypothetical protein [Alphaproteobacteria bacterium]